MFDEPDEVLARIDDDVRRAQQRAESLGRLQSAVDAVRGVARSEQHDIEVEVDSTGHLVRLQLDDQAFRRGGRQVSAEVMTLLARAQRDARAAALAATTAVLGEDDPMIGLVRAQNEAADATVPGLREGAR